MIRYEIKHYGDSAALVEFEQLIDEDINSHVIALKKDLESQSVPAIQYFIPAFCSLTIGYDPSYIDFGQITVIIERALAEINTKKPSRPGATILLPVCYEDEYALDMDEICGQTGLTREEVIHLHTNQSLRVYMLGFVAGFAYLGPIPDTLRCQRKKEPRMTIAPGSIGIAERQTGIYPSRSPGGWQIIGRTPVPMITKDPEVPFIIQAGYQVRFVEIDSDAFHSISQDILNNTFELENWHG